MTDVLGYLHAKHLPIKNATNQNIHTTCVFCHEPPDARGRLYINVDPDMDPPGLYLCHRCGESGNLTTLKRHFGDRITEVETDSHLRSEIMMVAATYYHDMLERYPSVAAYLKGPERGLHADTVALHALGYAPMEIAHDIDGGRTVTTPVRLYRHLRDAGYRHTDIIATGLCRDADGKVTDSLTGMITIPYHVAGQVVTIRGRTWPYAEADWATWEFGRYTPAKHKYKTLGGSRARLFNTDVLWGGTSEVSLCEGEMDCLVLNQAGFPAVGVPGAQAWQDEWDDYLSTIRRAWLVYDRDPAGERGAQKLADRFGAKIRRIHLSPAGVKCDPTTWFQTHTAADFADLLAEAGKGGLLVTVADAIDEFRNVQSKPGLRFGWEQLDGLLAPGLQPSQIMMLLARTAAGKGHPLDTEVPTPDGIRRWGDLVVGDQVFGSDGKPTKVVGVYDRGSLPAYEVSFSDGAKVIADGDHIWTVGYVTGHRYEWRYKDMNTAELAASDLKNRRAWRFTVPICGAVEYPERTLPIDPYTLGALIANGYLCGTTAVLSTPDADVAERVAGSHSIRQLKRPDGACPAYVVHRVIRDIRALGLDVRSGAKFVPEEYLTASVEQRTALLQGLFDGDGSCLAASNEKSSRYSTTSAQLARDVTQLVNSLGGTATCCSKDRGRYIEFTLSVMMPDNIRPFSSKRKDLMLGPRRYRTGVRRAITAVTPIGEREIRCIAVDAPDSLYLVGRSHVVTHNTVFLLNAMHRIRMVSGQADTRMLFLSLEQTRGEWWDRARRIHRFWFPDETETDAANWWTDHIRLVDRNQLTTTDITQILEDYEYEVGGPPDLICLDYLGYLARGFKGEAYERTGAAVHALKKLAKDYRIPFIVPQQVSRAAKDGEEFGLDAGRDAGTVEETADFLLGMWRPDDALGRTAAESDGLVNFRILKSRHGGRGASLQLQWSPVTLTLVPLTHPAAARARRECQWHRSYPHEPWEETVLRHTPGTLR